MRIIDYFQKQGFFPTGDRTGSEVHSSIGNAFYKMIMLPGQALGNLLLKCIVAKSKKNVSTDKVKGMVTQLAISQIVDIFNQYGPIVPVHKKWYGDFGMPAVAGLLLADMHNWEREARGTDAVSNIPTIVALFAYWLGRFGHKAKEEKDRAFLFSMEWSVYMQSYKDLEKKPDQNWPEIWNDFLPQFTVIGGKEKKESVLKDLPNFDDSSKRQKPYTPTEVKCIKDHTKTFKEWVDIIIVGGDPEELLTGEEYNCMNRAAVDFDIESHYFQFYKNADKYTAIYASCWLNKKDEDKWKQREDYLFPKKHSAKNDEGKQGGNEDKSGDNETDHGDSSEDEVEKQEEEESEHGKKGKLATTKKYKTKSTMRK